MRGPELHYKLLTRPTNVDQPKETVLGLGSVGGFCRAIRQIRLAFYHPHNACGGTGHLVRYSYMGWAQEKGYRRVRMLHGWDKLVCDERGVNTEGGVVAELVRVLDHAYRTAYAHGTDFGDREMDYRRYPRFSFLSAPSPFPTSISRFSAPR